MSPHGEDNGDNGNAGLKQTSRNVKNATTAAVENMFKTDDHSFTLRYLAGPKTGLNIHFFTADELRDVIGTSFTPAKPVVTMGGDLAARTRLQLISEQGLPRAKWACGS